jgi:lipoprotein-releasing system permease protein
MGMFELTVALRYLIPKKKSLSTALISLLSVFVISLVVWLVLVFLSVTTGIERNWLQKLTSLHAPLRLTPTEHYYSSYFYQSDSLSAASGYTLKTIGEKAEAAASDPYSDHMDAQIPLYWPSPDRHSDGTIRDLVKETIALLNDLHLSYQDYEISGALMKLSLSRPTGVAGAGATLSQMSYLLSFMDHNPHFSSLMLPPNAQDLDALLKSASGNRARLEAILMNASIEEVEASLLSSALLPENVEFIAFAQPQGSNEVLLPLQRTSNPPDGWSIGHLTRRGAIWQWKSAKNELLHNPSLHLLENLALRVKIRSMADELSQVRLTASGVLQGASLSGEIEWGSASLTRAVPMTKFDQAPAVLPPWAIEIAGRCRLPLLTSSQPFLLPKSYRDMGVRIGDRGSLNFSAAGAATAQEQRIAVQVAGFYDPGLFSMGARCLIVPPSVTRTIHAASQTFSPDGTPTNGISIWSDFDDTDALKKNIEAKLEANGLSPYWKVSTFKDYEFSRELFQQFRSDRTLFMLIAILILLVASCNIISLLVLLVNDKKREIAILQAMGASWKSVAAIFGCCGLTMGALSSLIGTAAAIITLDHLDVLVRFLSALQGHAAFQPVFFGQTLPNQLSSEALLFIFIATPLLSLLAGLVPALRASRIRPALALRQE